MSEARSCPRCEKEVPVDAPRGLCPTCLFGVTPDCELDPAPEDPTEPFEEPSDAVAIMVGPTPARSVAEGPGSRIGPYRLLQQLGEGGMGVVYMAEQATLDRRRVALKILKPGMNTDQFVARFEVERQALALMDHPNIAKVFDAGTTDSGRPYFVMELLKGVPITDYCDKAQLTPRERLELFVPACRAIQHAHQKGIIHRDIKPSNVLVTLQDGGLVPKVIDFGVAKAIDQRLTDRTLYTQFGAVIGTFEYMSPEQAEMRGLDIDTRSDIYSLGVLLYELLTGSTPIRRQSLRQSAFEEILRRIREEDPPRPSTRLSTAKELTSIAAHRRTEPAELPGLVRGELDWIVMKALDKDRARRYETASGLARDIERHLGDEPVEACPPSTVYRLRKFARKNRGLLRGAVAFAGLLLLAAVVGTSLALWASRAEGRANRRLIEVQHAVAGMNRALAETRTAQAATASALKESEAERRQAEAVNTFLIEVFRSPDPSVSRREFKVVDLLDRAVAKLDGEFAGDPSHKGALLNALGQTYHGLGLFDKAVAVLEKARDVRRASLGNDHPNTLATMNSLAQALSASGRTAEAVRLHEETLELRKAKLGPDHIDTLGSLTILGNAYRIDGRMAEAIATHRRALERLEAKLGPNHPYTLGCLSNLAIDYRQAGRSTEAIATAEETLRRREAKLGPDHIDTVGSIQLVADTYRVSGRICEALPLNEKAFALRKAKLGPAHPDTLVSMNNLGEAYRTAGRLAEAIPLLEEAIKLRSAKLGDDNPNTLQSMANLARALDASKRLGDAEALWSDLVTAQRRMSIDSNLMADHLASLGNNLLRQERPAEAESFLRDSLTIRERRRPDDWATFSTRSLLGGCLMRLRRYAEAEPLLLSGYEEMKAREARIPPHARERLTEAGERIVRLYRAWGRPEKAAAWRSRLTHPAEEAGPDS